MSNAPAATNNYFKVIRRVPRKSVTPANVLELRKKAGALAPVETETYADIVVAPSGKLAVHFFDDSNTEAMMLAYGKALADARDESYYVVAWRITPAMIAAGMAIRVVSPCPEGMHAIPDGEGASRACKRCHCVDESNERERRLAKKEQAEES